MSDEQEYQPGYQTEEFGGGEFACDNCGAVDPEVEQQTFAGFTGAACYSYTFKCCGHVDVDMDNDNLDYVK